MFDVQLHLATWQGMAIFQLIDGMAKDGIQLDAQQYTLGISACARSKRWQQATNHGQRRGCWMFQCVWSKYEFEEHVYFECHVQKNDVS